MSNFTIMTDSCCDLPALLADELGIVALPLHLHTEKNEYLNWLDGRDIGFKAFYEKVRGGMLATTSAVNAEEFSVKMRAELIEGRDILCLCFSSALSTTYQSAVIAAEELLESFPDRKICVIDTLCASLGQGLLVALCAREQKNGRTLEEVCEFARATAPKICHWFTVDDLYHLKRGGRVSATAALFGTMLSIKPVLHVDDEGRLVPEGKARGRKASLQALVQHMADTVIDPSTVFISHGDCVEDAEYLADEIRKRYPEAEILIHYIGPVIGNHAGPGTVALFFVGEPR